MKNKDDEEKEQKSGLLRNLKRASVPLNLGPCIGCLRYLGEMHAAWDASRRFGCLLE